MPKIVKSRKRFVVYMIRCLVTSKVYVGSTQDEVERMNNHFSLLNRREHHSIKLQRAYDKYGEKSFDFVICERELLEHEVRFAERNWIRLQDSFRNGYNMTDYTGQGTSLPEEQKRKMSKAALEVGRRFLVRQGRSERAKKQHQEGRIGRKKALHKYKTCKRCETVFELERNPRNGAWRENKLCEECAN